jgi:hypothetical protein
MERQIAAKVMAALLDAGSKLASTIDDVRGEVPEDQFKPYARAVGEVLVAIQLDLMAPIILEHPDLDPDGRE